MQQYQEVAARSLYTLYGVTSRIGTTPLINEETSPAMRMIDRDRGAPISLGCA